MQRDVDGGTSLEAYFLCGIADIGELQGSLWIVDTELVMSVEVGDGSSLGTFRHDGDTDEGLVLVIDDDTLNIDSLQRVSGSFRQGALGVDALHGDNTEQTEQE